MTARKINLKEINEFLENSEVEKIIFHKYQNKIDEKIRYGVIMNYFFRGHRPTEKQINFLKKSYHEEHGGNDEQT